MIIACLVGGLEKIRKRGLGLASCRGSVSVTLSLYQYAQPAMSWLIEHTMRSLPNIYSLLTSVYAEENERKKTNVYLRAYRYALARPSRVAWPTTKSTNASYICTYYNLLMSYRVVVGFRYVPPSMRAKFFGVHYRRQCRCHCCYLLLN